MYRIAEAKQEQIIAGLIEGLSIRSVERLTGCHRDTIMRFMVRTGQHCERLLDARIDGVDTSLIQCDEVSRYCRKKDARLTDEELADPRIGSQFVFIGMDAKSKLVLAHKVGKRSPETTQDFMLQLRGRVAGRPKIVTDGFQPYIAAVRIAFGRRVDFAQLVKVVEKNGTPVREAYTPAEKVVRCDPVVYEGHIDPHLVSTSYIERQNGTLRHMSKRFCRLTYAFSKRLENLKAAMNLHFMAYNFIRKHHTLKMTPAMAHGLTTRFWTSRDLLPEW